MNTMVKRLVAFLALAAFVFAAGAALAQKTPDKIRVVVLPFEVNADEELDYLKDNLPELLSDRLSEFGFSIVEMETVGKLLKEHEIEYLDLSTARDLALLAEAQYAIYGSFNQLGEILSLDVRLVEAFGVKAAKPLFVVQEGLINAVPAIEDLAEKVRMELMSKERIEVLAVEGTKVLDEDVVLMRLTMHKGDLYDPQKVNEQLKNIYDLGYFDDVQIRVDDLPEGVKVTFVVIEKPRISVVDVLGAEELDVDDILALMNTKTGAVLNPKVLVDDLGKIKEEYRKEGYYKATVNYEVEKSDEGQARLNIVVNEGDKLYIKEIAINGAEQLDPDDLRDELALGERGMFSWLTGSGVLKEEYLNRDAAALEAYYANHGFIRAQVGQPKVEFKDDGIYVTFEVKEGPRFKVGKVTFSGDLLESAEKLAELIELDDLSGEDEGYLDRSLLRSDAQKLTEYYSNYGYAFADAAYNVRPDEETLVADVDFQMSKRQKIYIRRVVLQGNDRTRDNVIRREMRLSDGDLFSGEKLRLSTRDLNNLGYFDQADIDTIPTEDEGLMDLKVKVVEKSTGELAAGAGFSSASGVYFTASVKENNLFGKGYKSALEGAWSGSASRYNLSFTDPNFNDSPWLVGGDVYYYLDDYDDYDRDTLGTGVRVGHPVGEHTYANMKYRLENYEIADVDDDAADEIQDIEGNNWASSLSADLVRSTLDRYLNPSKGMKSSVSVEYAGGLLLGDDEFIKYIADHSQYFPLWNDHVFHVHGQAGYVMENFDGEDIPVFEKFYLGGMNSVRGYKTRYISPRDEESGDRIGGNKMAFTNFEYLFPLLDEMGVMGVAFFDAGEVWDQGDSMDLDWKKSVGAGIRWYSAFGPLRLEYGYALDTIREQGGKGKLEFTIGQFF